MENQITPHHQQSSPTSLLRYPVLLFTYGLGVPILRTVERMGYAGNLLMTLGKKVRNCDILSKNFGHYQSTKHDIFVCAYPKSGTNWTLQIAYQIAERGHGDFHHIHQVIPWPDEMIPGYSISLTDDLIRKASPTGLRVIKTHLEWKCIPCSDEARYICVIRDPKEVVVSMYYFVRDSLLGPMMPSGLAPTSI